MTKDVLKAYAPIGVEVLKQNVQKVSVTGRTVDSIRSDVSDDRLLLIGRGYFQAIETGRGPRKETNYGKFDEGLTEWLEVKGFPTKTSKKGTKYYQIGNQWFSAKSLAWKINKSGDKMWRQGHGAIVRDVYSAALAKFTEELTQAVVKDKMDTFMDKVTSIFKDGSLSS